MQIAKLIFPHQLFQDSPLFQFEGANFLVEEYLFFRQYPFHKQKIAFHRASMKYYENYLREKKCTVKYIEAFEPEADVRQLIQYLHHSGFKSLIIIDPTDYWLLKRITNTCLQLDLELTVLDSPLFLNTPKDLSHFFNPTKKKFFQTEFYKQERIKRNILMEDAAKPMGGQWTYDTENRKRFPKGKSAVPVEFPAADDYLTEAHAYTKRYFSEHYGKLDEKITYPIGFEAAEQWLNEFLKSRFAEFGIYEDAIVHKELLLNHSLLTPMLNIGMLVPQQILSKTLEFTQQRPDIPLNSVEGFIRQIIGWREFIRGVYLVKGTEERCRNYWSFNKKIPQSFYDGSTGIFPVDETIKKVLNTGYCHHIERLMVLGNFMLLCEFDPDEVYRWFMELFIDAYDWVMVPNVYGMSQFADGGIMSTKPYISGSNYLMKMSDYPKGEWQEIWDGLFWRFLDRHRDFFLKNPRLSMLVKTFDKWDESKKRSVIDLANNYLRELS